MGRVNLGSDADFSAGSYHINELTIVQPSLDFVGRDAQADTIPSTILERNDPRGLVVSGIIVVDVGQAADGAAPAAED